MLQVLESLANGSLMEVNSEEMLSQRPTFSMGTGHRCGLGEDLTLPERMIPNLTLAKSLNYFSKAIATRRSVKLEAVSNETHGNYQTCGTQRQTGQSSKY
jgi:hypothetical protein